MVSVAACWTTSSLIMSSASVISLIFGLMVEGRSSDFGCCTTIGNTEDNTRTCHNYHCHYGPRSKYIPLLVMVMVMGGSSGGVGYGLRRTAAAGSRKQAIIILACRMADGGRTTARRYVPSVCRLVATATDDRTSPMAALVVRHSRLTIWRIFLQYSCIKNR